MIQSLIVHTLLVLRTAQAHSSRDRLRSDNASVDNDMLCCLYNNTVWHLKGRDARSGLHARSTDRWRGVRVFASHVRAPAVGNDHGWDPEHHRNESATIPHRAPVRRCMHLDPSTQEWYISTPRGVPVPYIPETRGKQFSSTVCDETESVHRPAPLFHNQRDRNTQHPGTHTDPGATQVSVREAVCAMFSNGDHAFVRGKDACQRLGAFPGCEQRKLQTGWCAQKMPRLQIVGGPTVKPRLLAGGESDEHHCGCCCTRFSHRGRPHHSGHGTAVPRIEAYSPCRFHWSKGQPVWEFCQCPHGKQTRVS